jgi:3'(2'), 5'-bisphosphate nucleotidase
LILKALKISQKRNPSDRHNIRRIKANHGKPRRFDTPGAAQSPQDNPGGEWRAAPTSFKNVLREREAAKKCKGSMTGMTIDRSAVAAMLDPLTEIAIEAGRAILGVDRERMNTTGKDDGSPVTAADFASDRVIAEGLMRLAPGIPVVSEERTPPFATPYDGTFFLVDPLDGTKEYVAGRSEYGVNIALIIGGEAVVGVIAAPAIGMIWRGQVGHGAERITIEGSRRDCATISTRRFPANWIATVSRSHLDEKSAAFLASRPGGLTREMGSSLKFCRIAEGAADVYPRLAPTCEWDLAAGCAILIAAGGSVLGAAGQPLRFGQNAKGFLVPEFMAWGDPAEAKPAAT